MNQSEVAKDQSATMNSEPDEEVPAGDEPGAGGAAAEEPPGGLEDFSPEDYGVPDADADEDLAAGPPNGR